PIAELQAATAELQEAAAQPADYVSEQSAVDANPWYRKWHSGWLEQGGFISVSGNGWNTVNLPAAFANATYTLVSGNAAVSNNTLRCNAYRNKTVSSFEVAKFLLDGSTWSGNIDWIARGQAAAD
ncbi:MAG: hypothetical protein LBL21_05095, partial [Rickettsiales bacterium]|nr:hypothetical protein [Rickettsiales bacterium]